MLRVFRSASFAALVLAAAACDDAPGARDPFGSPPVVSAFSFTPEAFEDVSGNATITVEPTISVSVAGGSGDITVRAFVRDLDGDELVGEADASGGPGRYDLRPTLTLPRGAVGDYEITVTTEDASGVPGDRASGVFTFSSASLGGPSVAATQASPATVQRPASGTQVVTLTANASDPDGPANLARVELRDPASGDVLFRFADDGQGGDATAADGQYTLRLAIRSGSPTGVYAFQAVAVDRTGRESVPADVSFTVQ